MSDLVVLCFDGTDTAGIVRQRVVEWQRAHLVELEDAVVVTRNEAGKVKLDQAINLTAAGAVNGALWGSLIGLLFLNPLLGLAVGAGAGAAGGALTDIGINDDFMREVGATLQPGASALFVLVRKVTVDKIAEELREFNPKVLQTSLAHDDEVALIQALTPKTPGAAADAMASGDGESSESTQ
ncbi:MAG: DUF1269 domain-containing protein [Chloroflexi bacterium]|nr:DUF1269 domain-containing protein [Chloroflexota bacterium]